MTAHSVLIYDDDPELLEICTYWLENRGWQVHTRLSAKGILADVAAARPDVILIDYQMPEPNGEEAIVLLRSVPEFDGIPVILFSARFDVEEIGRRAGADNSLEKPFDLKDLESQFHEVILNRKETT